MEKAVFSEREKLFLVQLITIENIYFLWLITDENEILENKKTDGCTLKLKNEAWGRITVIFNSQGFSKRSAKQLKKCWENIKQRKRKLNTTIRQEQLMTGGGPPIKSTDDPVMDFVDAAAPNLDVEVKCCFDSTAMYEAKNVISASTSTTPSTMLLDTPGPATPCIKKRRVADKFEDLDDCYDREQLLKKKVKDSILQQKELHEQRMKTSRMEYLLSVLKVRQQLNEMGSELNVDDIDFDNFNPKDFL